MFRNPYADGLIVLLVVLLIFGPKRLPTLGRSLGQGLREFKDSITGSSQEDEKRAELPSSSVSPATTSAQPAPEHQVAGSERSSAEVGSGPGA